MSTPLWQTLATRLGLLLAHNGLSISAPQLSYQLLTKAYITVSDTDLTTWLSTQPAFPLNPTNVALPWDAEIRRGIIVADVLTNAVYSDHDLLGFVNEEVDEAMVEAYLAKLVAAGVAYKQGDVLSYTKNVRDKGKVADMEAKMMHAVTTHEGNEYSATEFPFDANGRYITTYLPVGWTFVTENGVNLYSPPRP